MNIINKKRFLLINEQDKAYEERLSHFFGIHDAKLSTCESLKQGINKALSEKWDLILINFTSDNLEQIDFRRAITLFDGNHIPVILLYEHEAPSEGAVTFTKKRSSFTEFKKSNENELLAKTIGKTLKENGSISVLKEKIIRSSTTEKPLIVKILAGLLLFEPLIKIIFFWIITEFPFSTIFQNILKIESLGEVFEFWFLYPLGGIALMTKWSWSFLLFIFIQLIIVFQNLTYNPYTWPYVASSPHFSSVLLLIINILIVMYFFSRKGRKHFINKQGFHLREAERFFLNYPCEVQYEEWTATLQTNIQNISASGAFITCDKKIFLDDEIEIKMVQDEKTYHLKALVVNRRANGYGLKFVFQDLSDKKLIQKLVGKLSSLNKSA